jgi:hypothetical protein
LPPGLRFLLSMEGGGFAKIGHLLNAYYPNFDAPVESEATKQAQICRVVSSAAAWLPRAQYVQVLETGLFCPEGATELSPGF